MVELSLSVYRARRRNIYNLKRGRQFRVLRVRTHDRNFVPLIICNKTVTLLIINVPFCQINYPPSQINVPHSQINVPLSNKFPKFLRQNHDPRDIYLQEGHIFGSLFDHVYGPLLLISILSYHSVLTSPFSILELYNSSLDIPERHKIRRSKYFGALKL